MGAIMSGVRGGLGNRVTNLAQIRFVQKILNGDITAVEIEQNVRQQDHARTLTFVINNSCNLSCRHCYLQVESLTTTILRSEEWTRVFTSALQQNPDLICLSGKEIFLGQTGVDALNSLSQLKKKFSAGTRIGAITNGTLLHKHRSMVEQVDLDYLDISFDGGSEAHDALRGAGSFAAAAKNAAWTSQIFGNRLFAGLTVQRANFRAMANAITEITGLGIQTIGCGFYQRVPYSDETLALTDSELDEFFESLATLADVNLKQPTTLLFDLNVATFEASIAFMRSRWFAPEQFLTDERGEIFNEYLLPNGLRLQFSFAPYPTTIFKTARITPEGNYLAAEDTLDTRFYRVRTLGNVRDFDYDLGRLHEHASQQPRVKRIFSDYSEYVLPRFQEAFAIHTMLSKKTSTADTRTTRSLAPALV